MQHKYKYEKLSVFVGSTRSRLHCVTFDCSAAPRLRACVDSLAPRSQGPGVLTGFHCTFNISTGFRSLVTALYAKQKQSSQASGSRPNKRPDPQLVVCCREVCDLLADSKSVHLLSRRPRSV